MKYLGRIELSRCYVKKKKQAPWEKEKNEKIIIKFVNQDYIFAEENNVLQMKKKT